MQYDNMKTRDATASQAATSGQGRGWQGENIHHQAFHLEPALRLLHYSKSGLEVARAQAEEPGSGTICWDMLFKSKASLAGE